MNERYYGILASIDWNSKKWKDLPTQEDLEHSHYGYVIEHGFTHTSLNFGHEIYPTDKNGYYHGLFPQFWSRMPDAEKSKYVEILYAKAQNWRDKQNYIVGFYAFPIFKKYKIPSPLSSFPRDIEVNVSAFPKNIHLLENIINLSSKPNLKKFLPEGKKLGQQGFNYLNKENVLNILDAMTQLNPNDHKLSGVKLRLIKSI